MHSEVNTDRTIFLQNKMIWKPKVQIQVIRSEFYKKNYWGKIIVNIRETSYRNVSRVQIAPLSDCILLKNKPGQRKKGHIIAVRFIKAVNSRSYRRFDLGINISFKRCLNTQILQLLVTISIKKNSEISYTHPKSIRFWNLYSTKMQIMGVQVVEGSKRKRSSTGGKHITRHNFTNRQRRIFHFSRSKRSPKS